jgi:hypothetical protein
MSPHSSGAEEAIAQLIMAREGVIHDQNLEALINQSDPTVRAFDVMAPPNGPDSSPCVRN